jgi:hypothetical protein
LIGGGSKVKILSHQMNTTPRSIPLNFFGVPFGLLGLADCWLVAASFGLSSISPRCCSGWGWCAGSCSDRSSWGRLVLGPPLPAALMPTIAIEVAPAAVASFAVFVIDGHRVHSVVRLLAGYGLLMVIAQLRLLPAYLRLSFMPSCWAFTFAWAAVAFAGLSWLGVTHPVGWRVESYVALALISAFIGAIATRTAVALRRGQLLPAAVQTPPAAPDLHALKPIASA